MPRPAGRFAMSYTDPLGRPGWAVSFPNGTTLEGVTYVLAAGFLGATRLAPWYIGLIDASGFVAVAAGDTHAAHPGWAEYGAVYLSQRARWNPVAPSGGFVDCFPASQIQITAAGNVLGAFLASQQATGLSSGAKLFCTGAVASPLAVAAGGTVSLTYQLRFNPR